MNKIGLYLGIAPHAGGIFQYGQAVLEAVSALPRDKYDIVAACSSLHWEPYLNGHAVKAVYLRNGVERRAFWKAWRVMHLPVSVARTISAYADPSARTLLNERCDLWIFPSQDPMAFQAPVPALATIHDLMHRYEPRFPEVSVNGLYRTREWVFRNICKWADGILVDSNTGKIHVMESYAQSDERIHVLPYIPPKYIHSQQAPEDFRSRYRLPDKFIFYPAHFWEHKNHRNLISAVGRLKREVPDLKLVLVGTEKNGYHAALKQIQSLNLSDDIVILGHVADEDMPELYRRARALVMPTFFGPTNIPPREAFAVGCPVAVSGIYGIPEQVGDAALIFNPASVEEIAHCIKQLWTDDGLCATLVSRGRQRAAAWGQKQFNERFRDIIDQTLRARKGFGNSI
jgi:glycosyltransferase involved in cell wall biosynthesis